MSRAYSFDQMTADDHAALYAAGSVPTPAQVDGVWRMDIISNNNHLGAAAFLRFEFASGQIDVQGGFHCGSAFSEGDPALGAGQ